MHQVNAHIWYVVFGLFCWFWNQQSIAQHNQKLDSLLNVYQHQPDSENKIGTVSHLFNAMIYTNPEEAFDYAIEEIQLSEKFEKPRGYGMGHYHLSTLQNCPPFVHREFYVLFQNTMALYCIYD